MTWKKHEQLEAQEQLREFIKPGDTLYTLVKHVSKSGMYRTIGVYLIENNEPRWISRLVAKAIDERYDDKKEAIGVGGCGMDMGYHVVYSLSRVLFRDGFKCIGKGCPSNDHSNGAEYRKGKSHSDPGYALKQRWL